MIGLIGINGIDNKMIKDIDLLEKVHKIVAAPDNIVFMSGAGVSTESGIRDFRGKNGLYTVMKNEDPASSPEYLLSIGCELMEMEVSRG